MAQVMNLVVVIPVMEPVADLVAVLALKLPSEKDSTATNLNLCTAKDLLPATQIMMVSHYPSSDHCISLTVKHTMPTYHILQVWGGSKSVGNLG